MIGEDRNAGRATVGVVGLGAIGGHVARALVRSGERVVGFDVREEAYRTFPEVEACRSPRAAAEAGDVVLIAVYDDAQLREALIGTDGILSASPAPAHVCVLSTITVDTLYWAAEQAGNAGIELIDCGVTGGPALRAEGRIVVLAGGSDEAVEAVRPVLEAFAAPLIHMGALGAGMKAKLARNLIHYSGFHAAWEAARVAEACGIDVRLLVEAHRASVALTGDALRLVADGVGIDGPPGDEASLAYARRTAEVIRKDIAYVLALAEDVGLALPGAVMVRDRADEVLGLSEPAAE